MTPRNGPDFYDQLKKTETGKAICARDWNDTPLGDPAQWPASLKAALSICLAAPLPVAVWWGKDLVLIYNDALRDRLQIKDAETLGKNIKRLASGTLKDLSACIETAFESGEENRVNQQWTDSNLKSDNKYFTFINRPIYSEEAYVAGVITTLEEATSSFSAEEALKKIEENETRLRMAIESTNLGMWEYIPLSGELTWSDKCRQIYDASPDDEVSMQKFAQHIHPEDKPFVESAIAQAMDPIRGGSYKISYRILRFSDRATRWIRAHGKVYFDSKREPERFIGTVVDITEEKEHELKLYENEQRMRLALRASAMGTFDWDIIGSHFQYTDRLAEIFGYTNTKNLNHHHFVSRIHPDDSHIRIAAHEEAFKTGSLFYEARVIWPDGSIHWVRLNGYTLFDNNGQPRRMYGTTLDITESKQQADALEEKVRQRTRLLEEKNDELKRSEERYTKMTEEVQDYEIILLNLEGTILNWNKGAQKIKGYKEEEIVGKNFSIFYLDDDRQRKLPQSLIKKATEEGRAMHEGWRKRKDGSRFWGSIVITALHDKENNIIGFTKVTRDLTERKLAEDLMRQHATELEIKNKQLEQFAYIASHDLQEPLRKIQTFVQVLGKKIEQRETRQKYIDKINSSAKRMGDLIQSVLNYSRLSQTDELWSMTDLNVILENVKSDYEVLISDKNAVINSDPLPSIKGIPHQLSQLFANLISNALKFSKEKPVITITAQRKIGADVSNIHGTIDALKAYLELTFKDNGIGFDQQYAEKIFTIFQRLNSREDYAGTGIGLALCKRIVDNHHGYISATGAVGKGASFQIYLPIE